jgi:hypothetical protein
MPEERPRKLEVAVPNCDECPLRQFMDMSQIADAGWSCGHPFGHFRIADQGSYDEMNNFGDSVVQRMGGKRFPQDCPLPEVDSSDNPVERTRVVDLCDLPIDD